MYNGPWPATLDGLQKLENRVESVRRGFESGKGAAKVSISLDEALKLLACVKVLEKAKNREAKKALEALRGS